MSMSGWIPEKLLQIDDTCRCRWLFAGTAPFIEPFFDETILHCKQQQQNRRQYPLLTGMEVLSELAKQCDSAVSAAVIFHVSRCGSTLFSQLLGLNRENIVLAEVPVFDEILRLKNSSPAERETWLADAIRLHTQKRTGNERRFFIKTDSWHIFFAPVFRRLFPQTPFILIYRSPEDVLRSHQKQRGIHMVPGLIEPELYGFDPSETLTQPIDTYSAQVLRRFYESFLKWMQTDGNSTLVNYAEGFPEVLWPCCAKIGYFLRDEEKQQMIERTRFHAKRPGEAFSGTRQTQRFPIPPATVAAYEQLNQLQHRPKTVTVPER